MLELLLHRLFGIGELPNAIRSRWGVVAHTAAVLIAFLTAMGAIVWALRDSPQLVTVIVIIAVIVVFFLSGTWIFAHLHPDQAAIGGSDLAGLRRAELDSKFGLIVSTPTTDPDQQIPPPPKLIEPPDQPDG